ncbi:unnamed protein product [Adineta steineri]|uniref:Uncharacterized protein n=1 Tax=Adineta steineri TaxID=433720 RepID=A0A814FL56_9BILA|nr:unnamed protein product [Adineta steineri]CAF0988655.1 unnamed protein product [Adineta steineri]
MCYFYWGKPFLLKVEQFLGRLLQWSTAASIELLKNNRINILLSLLSYKQITSPPSQLKDHKKMKILEQNPQLRETLFPWAMSL